MSQLDILSGSVGQRRLHQLTARRMVRIARGQAYVSRGDPKANRQAHKVQAVRGMVLLVHTAVLLEVSSRHGSQPYSRNV